MRLDLKRKACLWQAITNDGTILYSSIDKNRVMNFVNTWSRQITQTLKTRIPLNQKKVNKMTYNIAKDKRYTQNLEWCGFVNPLYVARFCGEYISAHETKEEAIKACKEAYNQRMNIESCQECQKASKTALQRLLNGTSE